MVTVQEALRLVLADVSPLGCERVMLRQARGRVLGEAVVARRDVPPFRNSAMDGYAVRAADLRGAATRAVHLRLQETVGAGSAPSMAVSPGSATKIMTGSPLPEGADTVVRFEDGSEESDRIVVEMEVGAGANVRECGEDVRAGETVLMAGRALRPADIGLLASLGVAVVAARRRPRVAIVSTGDELVEVGEALGPGQIVNSNAYTLAAAVEEAGAESSILGIARDEPAALRAAFTEAMRADVVLSTGGVSVGSFDYVRRTHADLGVEEKFWRVAQKPGKPLSYGVCRGKPVLGLPGNPVSSLVCFYLYVLPLLRRLMGMEKIFLPAVDAVAEDEIRVSASLTEFVRCELTVVDGERRIRPTRSQSSGVLRSMSAGDALAVAPAGVGLVPRGVAVRAILLVADMASSAPPF